MDLFVTVLRRDLKLAFRRWSELANPLLFFLVVTAIFPLALPPSAPELEVLGTGILWVAALLSSLLGLDGLFRNDAEDGTLEQLMLSPAPFGVVVLAKVVAHWIASGVPLIGLVPVVALSFYLPSGALGVLVAALLLATPTISIFVALGAALTVSLKNAGSVIGLLILPLCAPLLIFGTRATDFAAHNEIAAGPLYLLASLAVLAVSLGPIAIAAALRVGLE
jgi:heme exporter protein B